MLAIHAWKRLIGTTESADLDDLRRDIVPLINVATLIIGWLVTLSAIVRAAARLSIGFSCGAMSNGFSSIGSSACGNISRSS